MANPTLSAAFTSSTNTLTVTLNNPPASGGPTTAVLSLLGTTLTSAFSSSWQATFAVEVHPSVATGSISALVSVEGQASGTAPISPIGVQLGTLRGPVLSMQVVAPSSTGDPYLVAPTQRAVLRAYYTGLLDQSTALDTQTAQPQALYVVSSVVLHTLVSKIIPALQSTTYTPIVLNDDEQNALSDLTTNVLPTLTQNLGTIYPSGGTPTVVYAETKAAAPTYEEAMTAYEAAVSSIPNLE